MFPYLKARPLVQVSTKMLGRRKELVSAGRSALENEVELGPAGIPREGGAGFNCNGASAGGERVLNVDHVETYILGCIDDGTHATLIAELLLDKEGLCQAPIQILIQKVCT